MKAAHEFIDRASELVRGNRANTHGDKRVNHGNIAALWNAYLRRYHQLDHDLSEADVAKMMVLLKVARTMEGDYNEDDFVDMVGYAGIAGELENEPTASPLRRANDLYEKFAEESQRKVPRKKDDEDGAP